eukprot:7005376-Alexandrium_andersonii.AAC.1
MSRRGEQLPPGLVAKLARAVGVVAGSAHLVSEGAWGAVERLLAKKLHACLQNRRDQAIAKWRRSVSTLSGACRR